MPNTIRYPGSSLDVVEEEHDEGQPLLAPADDAEQQENARWLRRYPVVILAVVYTLFLFHHTISRRLLFFYHLKEHPSALGYDWMNLLASVLTIGAWCHLSNAWKQKSILLLNVCSSILASALAIVVLHFTTKEVVAHRMYIIHDLFGGKHLFSAVFLTYTTEIISQAYIFPAFIFLMGIEGLTAAIANNLTIMLSLAQPLYVGYLVTISIGLLTALAIALVLPKSLDANSEQVVSSLKDSLSLSALVSPGKAAGGMKMVVAAVFVHSLTSAFEIVRLRFGLLSTSDFAVWYIGISYLVSQALLLFVYPFVIHLFNKGHSEQLVSSYRFTQSWVLWSLFVHILCAIIVLGIGASSGVAHLIFDIPITFVGAVKPGLYSLVALAGPSVEIFAALNILGALGELISRSTIWVTFNFATAAVALCRILFAVLVALLIVTAMLVALAPAEREQQLTEGILEGAQPEESALAPAQLQDVDSAGSSSGSS